MQREGFKINPIIWRFPNDFDSITSYSYRKEKPIIIYKGIFFETIFKVREYGKNKNFKWKFENIFHHPFCLPSTCLLLDHSFLSFSDFFIFFYHQANNPIPEFWKYCQGIFFPLNYFFLQNHPCHRQFCILSKKFLKIT